MGIDANDMNEDGRRSLKDRLKGKIVFVGIGNSLRGDDGFGPELIRELKQISHSSSSLLSCSTFFDVGEVPENYLQKIIAEKPDTIILIDAVRFNAPPGTISIFSPEEITNEGLSTHNISLGLVSQYLQSQTSANIFMLGVQPKSVDFGDGISDEVKKAIETIVERLKTM